MVEIMAKETEKKKAEEAYFLKAPYLQLTSYTCV